MPIRTYHLIPHTHWDREWYLTRAAFGARLVPALDDLIERLESEPGFRAFVLDGQTVHLEDYLAVRPEMGPRVRALVETGRLQLGPWYVLADELIPSGESLVRNLLVGRAQAERYGGRLDVLYSPDAFGHPAVWPALGAEFGIAWGVLWRGLGGEPGQEGDLYRWRAPDGREVLVHHLSPGGYEVGAGLPVEHARLAAAWPKVRAELEARARTPHVAVFVGADHHAAHPAVGLLCDLLAELEPGAEVRVSRLDQYLAAASATAGELPRLNGELRWSYGYTWTLQGVHATRAPLKRLHAEAELALERLAEPLAALALWHRGYDARPLLGHAWRALLRSQFHDSIGGCTSDAVADRVRLRLGDAAASAGEIARASLDALTGNDPDAARDHPDRTSPALVLFNPVPRPRNGVVVTELSWFRRDVLVGPPGGRAPRSAAPPADRDLDSALAGIPHQILSRGTGTERLDASRHYPDQDEVDLVRVAIALPELGGFSIGRGVPRQRPAPVELARGKLSNGLLELSVGRNGLVELTDTRTGTRFRRLLALESEADRGDTYTFEPDGNAAVERVGWSKPTVVAGGPLVAALELRSELRGGGVLARLTLALHAGSPLLRCTLDLENAVGNHRLRLRIPTGVSGEVVVAGGPFGAIRRKRRPFDPARYPRETPVSTAPAQRFVAAAGIHGGLAVLAPGFFEYEHEPGGDLLVTLLRCVGELSREDLRTRPGHAGWPIATPGAQCRGRERIQLALAPLSLDVLERVTPVVELWEDAFVPPRAIWLRQATPLIPPAIDLGLEGEGLVFSSLKAVEGERRRIVFRCYNATGEQVEGRLLTDSPLESVERTRADEREDRRLAMENGGTEVRFTAGPHEIVTLVLTPG
ncbi:MAG TPA: glycoside hydrolase family 38 C-terminal domain-containing protein [Gemmatimonadales bacterium]|jgi:alpha-mannosidase